MNIHSLKRMIYCVLCDGPSFCSDATLGPIYSGPQKVQSWNVVKSTQHIKCPQKMDV